MMKEANEVRMGRYLSGEAGIGEREAFEQELESDPAFKAEFLTFQRIWTSIPVEQVHQWNSEQAWQKFAGSTTFLASENFKPRRLNLRWAVAAAILISFGTFILFWNQGRAVTYVFNPEKAEPLMLTDGSKIYLNKDAKVEVYSFKHKNRRVTLYGEAYFEVNSDPDRPFIVRSGGTSTEVVGTSFTITQASDHTRVFVQKGKVIFRSLENETDAVALTEGEAAIYKGKKMELIPNPSLNSIAWHTRQLNFDRNMTYGEILADASAFFGLEIILENVSLKECRISNSLSYTNPGINAVLKPLASFVNGTIRVEGNRCMILGGRCP